MVVSKSVKHHIIQSLCGFWSFSAPPEPGATSLVQRTPNNGDLLVLKSVKLHGDRVEVSESSRVLFSAGLNGATDVEVGIFGVKRAGC